MDVLRSLLCNREGATAVEYGLIAAVITVALLVGFQNASNALLDVLTFISETIEGAWV
ncbi:Flp family type IVb pilin [Sinorhizobium saheli]|jgi:pilus assembly protein Flp/PilA|uniref:Pilin n=1 Tax=Sinorhizobium saheli TaxID=36856 RepID=A0A178Y9K3_SINSA|nr:Flp family type IVb pilin [Sinorhizobium saheli]MQW87482.1 Flp family type IVb pilin [Sinorhizobium saheli]OAP43385.1 pilin [Sinorhizobium saheli]